MKTKCCQHPPSRLYSWWVDTNTSLPVLCVACCECGDVLRGAVDEGALRTVRRFRIEAGEMIAK